MGEGVDPDELQHGIELAADDGFRAIGIAFGELLTETQDRYQRTSTAPPGIYALRS